MQFNVKHYIAMGLCLGLAAAYCLHLGFTPEEKSRSVRPGNLQSLSKLEASGQVPEPDFVNSASVAKLQQDSVPESLKNQNPIENDFVPPEIATGFEDSLTLLPVMLQDDGDSQSNSEADSSKDGIPRNNGAFSQQADSAALVNSQISPTRSIEDDNTLDQQDFSIQLNWKKNPYVGDGSNVHATFNSSQSVISLQDQSSQDPQSEAINSFQDQTDDLVGQSHEASVLQQEPMTIHESNPDLAPQRDFLFPQEDETTETKSPRRGLTKTAAQQAVQHIEYGKSLARRGAAFAARQEFFLALSIIAQSNDESFGSNEFSRALTGGFLALKETEGFVMDNIEAGTTLDIASVVASHRSTVLTQGEAKRLTPAQAKQRYFEFAQDQLDHACGGNVVSAEAFFCLGKLYAAMSSKHSVPSNLDASKSIVFHMASFQCDKQNYRSANELGVLMAQTGRLEEATEFFKQSLILNRTPQAWLNLAKTHRRLGERDFAELAEAEFVLAAQAPLGNPNGSTASIQWMPTTKFNSLAPVHNQQQIATKPADLPKTKSAQDKLKSLTKSFSDRLKDLF